MKIDRQQELKNCTHIKTILMITVVLGHAASVFGGWGPFDVPDKLAVFSKLSGWLGAFHIYGFALISGYLFHYIKYEKGGVSEILTFSEEQGNSTPCTICIYCCDLGHPGSYLFLWK